ncbi:MAG: hypothetical protein RLZZ165_1458 [Bacteroidota bacterium]
MKHPAFLSALLFSLHCLPLSAQQAPRPAPPAWIVFEETTHDFGSREYGSPAEWAFKFRNVSRQAVRISAVKAGCGCMSSEWPREDILPGKGGAVRVSYPSQRPGEFRKPISVTCQGRPDPVILYIQGRTGPAPGGAGTAEAMAAAPALPAPDIAYSVPRGGLTFERTVEDMGRILTSEEDADIVFRFRNTSSSPISIRQARVEAGPEVTLAFQDETVPPGQESSVTATISGRRMKALGQPGGYFSREFAFHTDEGAHAKKELSLRGSFKPIYTEREKATSPHIEFVAASVEGERVIEGEQYVHDFIFRNTGQSPLTIISAQASCGCTAIRPPAGSIAPGDSAAITATFDSRGRLGTQSKSIVVTTNDIGNPTVVLRFSLEVVRDPFHAADLDFSGEE